MPLAHVLCCDEVFTVEGALEHVATRKNRCHWTWELLSAMFQTSVAHPSNADASRISTTVLTQDCLRSVALDRFNDYTVTPDDLWASFRGTMFHKQLEQYAATTSYGEARFFVTDLGVQIPAVKKAIRSKKDRSFSGSPDLVDPGAGTLYDYKRTKEVPRYSYVYDNHIQQLNVNRWLVDHADTVEHLGVTYDLLDPEVRARFVPVEWQELVIVYVDDRGPKPIAVTKSIDVPKVGGQGTKKARVADVWSDETAETFIAERYIAARAALTTGSAPIPAGWEGQSKPLCNYCPSRTLCADLERRGE